MTWINTRQYADKMITLFADNRVMQTDWNYMIPHHIIQQPLPLIANAKLFADGLNTLIVEKNIIIPKPTIPIDLYGKNHTSEHHGK